MSGLMDYLGLSTPAIENGFEKNPRVGSLVCRTCGELVTYETQSLHRDWHRSQHDTSSQNPPAGTH